MIDVDELKHFKEKKSIENGFPTVFVSALAQHESWRKEVYRPLYYIHKWWARRLGSVFRSLIISSSVGSDADVSRLFYSPVRFPNTTVYDPFMGSGTTIGEAIKLGCRVIGRDINPVSYKMVSAEVVEYSKDKVLETFDHIRESVGREIEDLYSVTLDRGEKAKVLYYFWVKTTTCPACDVEIDLFKTRIFISHAYPRKHPDAKAICPFCRAINETHYSSKKTRCLYCQREYNPQTGNIRRSTVRCPACKSEFSLLDHVRQLCDPLAHKMFAKLVLKQNGDKVVLPIDQQDLDLYKKAENLLPKLKEWVPSEKIETGYNTRQVLNYNYLHWSQMFNSRQLVCLALLASEISRIEEQELKSLFACLFSSILEFNNMFASFKGEGTGAVRHMFSHHILKTELMPIEANVWGTPKSSGSFSTLFTSKILRALQYKDNPFEISIDHTSRRPKAERIFNLSSQINQKIAISYSDFRHQEGSVYLSVGDSSKTDIENESIDLVVTDPPFFDNVHYSELADFFYVWLRRIFKGEKEFINPSTRVPDMEVQSSSADEFSQRLTLVLKECNRVLKRRSLLVLTYHHARVDGWIAFYRALRKSGFVITQTHPVKSEMAVSIPIQKSAEKIDFDLIFVCKKDHESVTTNFGPVAFDECLHETKETVDLFSETPINVSLGDIKLIFVGRLLSRLSAIGDIAQETAILETMDDQINEYLKTLKLNN